MIDLKISVITPSFNQGQFIERTIQSVLSQNYPNLEYIIIDGGSTDETVEIVERYQSHLTFVSEPDSGQANAINKGFKRATGDVVCWLNSDDEYLSNTLPTVADYFTRYPEASFLYGDAIAIDTTGRSYGKRGNVRSTNFVDLVSEGDFIVQPAAFWRSHLLETIGYLDETLNYCLDYEYWLRIAEQYPLHYLSVPLAKERFHSEAKTTGAGLKRIQEIEEVIRRYGRNEIPRRFRAEKTAVYLYHSICQLLDANGIEALRILRCTGKTFYPSLRFIPHLLALFLGSKGATWLRLHKDLVRSQLRFNDPATHRETQ